MTRRTIFILVTLFVTLFVTSQATVVNAHDVCGDLPGQWCGALAVGGALHNGQETDTVAIVTEHINKAESSQNAAGRWMVTQVREDGIVHTGFVGGWAPEMVTSTQLRETSCMTAPAPCETP